MVRGGCREIAGFVEVRGKEGDGGGSVSQDGQGVEGLETSKMSVRWSPSPQI